MQPEWSENPEVGPMMLLYGLTGLLALVFLTIAFAYYW